MTTAIAIGTLYAGAWRAEADFIQTNLVSDIPGLAAITDPELHNPWGISHTGTFSKQNSIDLSAYYLSSGVVGQRAGQHSIRLMDLSRPAWRLLPIVL
jgi:hypothetical protein